MATDRRALAALLTVRRREEIVAERALATALRAHERSADGLERARAAWKAHPVGPPTTLATSVVAGDAARRASFAAHRRERAERARAEFERAAASHRSALDAIARARAEVAAATKRRELVEGRISGIDVEARRRVDAKAEDEANDERNRS